MKIYIDEAFRCHMQAGEGMTEAESAFFDGKCEAFIEAYRFVPKGSVWRREDGAVFHGEMIAPHADMAPALAAQQIWDKTIAEAAECAAAYDEGVQSAWA